MRRLISTAKIARQRRVQRVEQVAVLALEPGVGLQPENEGVREDHGDDHGRERGGVDESPERRHRRESRCRAGGRECPPARWWRYAWAPAICAAHSSERFCISSGETSSMCVAIVHVWPKGSWTRLKRSPQNMSSGSISDVAPESIACL